MKATWMRLCLALVLLAGLSACGDTWKGVKEDTADNMEKTGEAIEKTGEKIDPQ